MSSIAYDLFEAAPSWVRLSIVLGLSYSAYLAWSAVVRFNREWKVASRILDERRKAGIPDTDKRPFRIAKAAVDATRSSSDYTLKHRVTFSSDLHDGLQSSQSSPNNPREEGLERTNVSSTSRSKARRRSSLAPRTSTTSDSKAPGSSRINSPSSPASVAPLDPHQKSDQPSRLKHKRAYAPSEYAPSELSHCGSPDIISQTRTTKKVKTKSTLKSPNKRGLPSTAEINRKKTKLSLPGDLSIQEGPAEDGYGSQEEDSHMTEIEKGRKRILSQAVSEAELSHELKHKRGKSARQPDDDELEREQTDMNDLPPSDGDKMQEDDSLEVDQDVFMIAENGQRKKLITIKPLSDNQSDQQIEEDSTERRWVTRSEFERLKRTGKLHDSEEIWDDRSTTPSDTMNISVDYSISNPTQSPRTRPTTEVEYGPIWSIEGKPSSRPSLSEAPLTAKLRTSARPRNSLGRMRLSLPPDPVSPARRSRSKINSLLQDDRYIDDRTSGESQLAIQSTSEEQAGQPSPNAEVSGRAAQLSSPSETLNTNPVSTPQPQQLHPSSTTGHASTTSTAFNVGTAAFKQQAPSGAVQTGNSNTSLFAPKATNSFSFGSAPPQPDKAPPSVSLSEVSKTQSPASSSPFSFGAVAANTGSIASQPLFGSSNANSASSSFAQSTQFSTSETLPKTVAVAPKVDLPKPSPFAFNSISSPAPVKEKSIFQSSESSSAFSFKSTNSPGGDKADKPGFSAGTSQLPSPQPTTKPAASSFSPFGASTTPFSFQTGQPSTKTDNIEQLARSSDPISGASPGHKADAISHNNDTSVKSNTISTTSNFSFGPKSTTDPSSSKQIHIDANAISATSASLSGSGSDSSLTLENDSPSQEASVSQEKSGSTAGQESTPGRRTARLKSNRLTAGPQRVLANAMSNVGKQVGLSTVKSLQNEPNKSTETIAEEAEPATSSTEDGATKVSTSGDLARPSGFGNVNASTEGTNNPSTFSFSAAPQSESTQSTTSKPISFTAASAVPTSTVSAFGSATTPSFSFGTPAKSTAAPTSSLPPVSGGGNSAFSFGSTTAQNSNPLNESSKPASSFSFDAKSSNNTSTFGNAQPTFGASSSASTNPSASTTTTTPLFGATSNVFGNPTVSSTTTNIFGKPAASNTTTSVFGNPTASSTTPSVFGNPTASTTTTSMFGNSATSTTSPSMFGNPTASTTTPSLFGNPTASSTTPSLFGNPTASSDKPVFGNPAGSSSAFIFNTGTSSTTNTNTAVSTPPTFNFTVSAPQVATKDDDQKR